MPGRVIVRFKRRVRPSPRALCCYHPGKSTLAITVRFAYDQPARSMSGGPCPSRSRYEENPNRYQGPENQKHRFPLKAAIPVEFLFRTPFPFLRVHVPRFPFPRSSSRAYRHHVAFLASGPTSILGAGASLGHCSRTVSDARFTSSLPSGSRTTR